jgi:hypothetical protein
MEWSSIILLVCCVPQRLILLDLANIPRHHPTRCVATFTFCILSGDYDVGNLKS